MGGRTLQSFIDERINPAWAKDNSSISIYTKRVGASERTKREAKSSEDPTTRAVLENHRLTIWR